MDTIHEDEEVLSLLSPASSKRPYDRRDDSEYFVDANEAMNYRRFRPIVSPITHGFGMGADIVDKAQDKLVNALVFAFAAHMGAKEASFTADIDEHRKAQFILNDARKFLKDDLREVYNTLAINDGAILLILNKINRELHNIKIDDDDDDDPLNKIAMNDIISTIVNENIRYDEVIHYANKVRQNGGKTNRKHRTKRKHRTNRKHRTKRKHRTNRKHKKNS